MEEAGPRGDRLQAERVIEAILADRRGVGEVREVPPRGTGGQGGKLIAFQGAVQQLAATDWGMKVKGDADKKKKENTVSRFFFI